MMTIILMLMGFVVGVLGILLLVAPDFVYQMNHALNKRIFSDGAVFSHRVSVAIIFIAMGVLLLITSINYFGV